MLPSKIMEQQRPFSCHVIILKYFFVFLRHVMRQQVPSFVWKRNEMLRIENVIDLLLKQWVYISFFVSLPNRKTALES